MEPDRFDRVKAIFSEAAEKSVAERSAFLDQACAGDSALRREVEKLLGQMAETETVDIFATQPRHTLQRGDVLEDRFRIVRFIGKGGMGEVYEANDQELGGPVALKILKPDLIDDPQFLGRFRREVQLARQVTHPNVCRVFDVGHDRSFDQERVFITMELLDGETLADHLRQSGRLSADAALPLINQMADGLDALHQKGIIHRDFKPANVLVIKSASGSPRAVISDFGLARAMEPDTAVTNLSRTSHILGTPDYMAPEQLLGAPVTCATDIYALGLIMYEMVTGKKAFPGGRALENAVQRVVEQPSPPQEHSAELSASWNTVILRCLARDPRERPASAAEVVAGLGGNLPPWIAPAAPVTRRAWFARSAILLGILALSLLGLRLIGRLGTSSGGDARQHVALLPLNVLSDEPELRVFALGLMETITSRLSQFETGKAPLLVVPASEVRSQEAKTAGDAKKKFRVTAAVEGTVQSQGDRVRLTLTLINADEMRQVETIVLEDQRSNALRLQDAAVTKLANALNVRLQPKYAREHQEMIPIAPGAYEFYLQARGYLQRSDQLLSLDSAIKLLNRALDLDPKYALAYSGLGEAFLSKYELTRDPKLFEAALKSGEQGLALNPNLGQTNISMGRIHLGTGRHQEAQQDFEKAIALDSRNNEAYQGLANAYAKLKDDKRAEATYLQAISLRTGDWTGYKHLGMFYYERQEYDKAIAQYGKVVELSPDNAQGYVNLGAAQAMSEDWASAEKTFLRALELDPKRDSTITNLAKVYYERQQFDRAIEYYRKALDLNSSYQRWGNLGMAYKRAGNDAKARESLGKAIQLLDAEILLNPRRGDRHSYLGFYRAMLGRPDYRTPLQTALLLTPVDLNTVSRVAEAYAIGGDTGRAVELVKQLIAQGYNVKSLQRSHELRGLLAAAGVPAKK